MRFLTLIIGIASNLLLFHLPLPAQTIQWASEVVSFSSEGEKGGGYHSAQQALGVPNAISSENLSQFAWRPKHPDGGKEHIQVRFKNAIKGVQQVIVSESASPGSITKIILIDDKGKNHVIHENKDNRSSHRFAPFNLFKKTIPPTDYYVKECRLEMNTKKVPGVNIDAIGISTYPKHFKIRKLVDNLNYSSVVHPPENLGPRVNSPYAERLPIISPDGNTLYFTRKFDPSNMGGQGKDDIWVSQRMRDGQWGQARNIGAPLNTNDHNFAVAVNPAGNRIYLGNMYQSKQEGISVSSLEKGVWSKPNDQKITGHYNDSEFVEYHLSVDEQVLLMAVQRKEGFGDRDLYVSFNQGSGRWTSPKNLGSTVNTVGMESGAFLAADGRTLYFCSNGHYNYGGLDIFMTQRLDESWTRWSPPKNLGPVINTPGNDYNFSIPASGEYAYFSSGKQTYGDSDLFRILLPEEARPQPVMLMTGRVVDANTQKPVQADLNYQSLDPNEPDKTTNPSAAHTSDEGDYQVVLPYGQNMELYAKLEGYFPVSESMELSDESLEELDSDSPDDPMLRPSSPKSKAASKEERALQDKLALIHKEIVSLEEAKQQIGEASSYHSPSPSPKNNTYTTQPQSSRPSKYESQIETPTAPTVPKDVAGFFPDIPDLPRSAPKDNRHNSSRDMDLKDLRDKYYLHQKDMMPEAKYEEASEQDKQRVRDMYGKLQKNKEMEKTVGQGPAVQADKDNPEVNELYDKLYGQPKAQEKTPEDVVADTPSTNKQPQQDGDEVDAMYEKLYGKPRPASSDAPAEKSSSPTPPASAEADANGPQEDIFIPSFEDLEAEIREEVKQELADQIRAELKQEMLLALRQELEAKDKATTAPAFAEATQELERENLMELEMLKSEPPHLATETDVEAELKQIILADVQEELKEELQAEAKLELQAELALKTKEKERDATQDLIDAWKKRRESPTASDPTNSSEAPSSSKPEYVEMNKDIQVVPIKVGQVIPMNNIFFEANKSNLKPVSSKELDRVLGFLKENPKLVVEVGGHTNGWCSSSFAAELSSSRAKEVRQYFIAQGIPEKRIQYRGYGKTLPIATNDTLAGRKKNQRVELKILEILD